MVGIRPAVGKVTGHRHAAAALKERMDGFLLRKLVEGVEPDSLVHQHRSIIENPQHNRVTARYDQEKSPGRRRTVSVAVLGETPQGAIHLGLGLGAGAGQYRLVHSG